MEQLPLIPTLPKARSRKAPAMGRKAEPAPAPAPAEDATAALRAELDRLRAELAAVKAPAVATVSPDVAAAFGMGGMPGVTVAPAPAPAMGREDRPDAATVEAAALAYKAARRALNSRVPSELREALAGLPAWRSPKNTALRAELARALGLEVCAA